MKLLISSVLVLCIVQFAIAAPITEEKKDLSSILNLLPHGGSSKPNAGNNNNALLGLLGSLTNGTQLHSAIEIMQLLNSLHTLEGDLTSIPTSVLHALNQTVGILTGTLSNLTSHIGTTGKRGGGFKKDLSSILNLLPHGGSSKPNAGNNNNALLGLLGSLTNGTQLHSAIEIMQLLNSLHTLEGDLTSIPTSVLHALNQTVGILTGTLSNLTSHIGTTGKRGGGFKKDLSSILNLLPHGGSSKPNAGNNNNALLGLLGSLTNGTQLHSAIEIMQLLNSLHTLEGDLTSIPTSVLHALNQTVGILTGTLSNLTSHIGTTGKRGGGFKKDLSSILNLLPHGGSSKPNAGNNNNALLGLLGSLTNGTQLHSAIEIMQLLNSLHTLEGDLTSIPTSVLHALNQTVGILTGTLSNLTSHIGTTGKRGGGFKKDLSSILNLLPHGGSSKPNAGNNNNALLGLLGSLTNGTQLHSAIEIMQLLNSLHTLEGDLTSIPTSVLHALNQTVGILTGTLSNLTSHIGTTGKRGGGFKKDLSSILNLLPHGGSSKPNAGNNNNALLGLLGSLTNGTQLHSAIEIMQLLNSLHTLEGDLTSIPTSVLHALNQTVGILTGTLSNLTSHIGTTGKRGGGFKKDLSSILNLLPHGGSSKPNAGNNNNALLGLLGSLTNGTQLHSAIEIMQLLNSLHTLEGDLTSIPTSVLHALNQTVGILTGTLSNLTSHIGTTGKRGGGFKKDLSSILNLLPHGGSSKPNAGNNNNALLGLLGSLTNGTQLHSAIEIMQLLNSLHTLEGDLTSIPTSVLHALNQTVGILTGILSNLTSHIGTTGKRDLTSILSLLPPGISQTITNILNQLPTLPNIQSFADLVSFIKNFAATHLNNSGLSQTQINAINQVIQVLSSLNIDELLSNLKPIILPGK